VTTPQIRSIYIVTVAEIHILFKVLGIYTALYLFLATSPLIKDDGYSVALKLPSVSVRVHLRSGEIHS
jgi:hypothetical protein